MPDIERYRRHVERLNGTQSQKDDAIRIIWRIVNDFVDRAWGVHPVQQCEQLSQENILSPKQEHATLPDYAPNANSHSSSGITGGPK